MENSNEEAVVDATNNEAEGNEVEKVEVLKKDYDTLNQTLGSLKREIKDLKKSSEKPSENKETVQTKPDDSRLLEKAYLRSANIVGEDEVELALTTAKKWDMSIDKLVDDEDFKTKLEKLRTQKANEVATSNIKGSAGSSQAKNTLEYWKAKGTPPTPTDIPDRKARQKIVSEFLKAAKGGGKTFYNE